MILLLMILCVGFYTGQTFMNRMFSGRYKGAPTVAGPVFSVIYGAIVAVLVFLLNGMRFSPSTGTLILGIVNGLILFLYNLGMVQAARRGPYTFQSITMLFGSIVVVLIFSVLVWKDSVTALQLAGILIMLCAFVLLNAGGLTFSGIKKGYYFWIVILFFSNGFYGVLMDAQQRLYTDERNEMIMLTFGALALISILYLKLVAKAVLKEAFAMDKRSACYAALSSVCAAFAVFLTMVLLKSVPSYVLYTIKNGGILVMSALLSAIILKEKPTGKTLAGVALSVVSIVMLGRF